MTLTANSLSHLSGSQWEIGVSGPSNPGVADENVELAPALENRRAEPVERREIGDVAGNQRRLGAERADFVVELLQRALRARQRDDMGAAARQLQRDGAADAARGAGDEGDAAGEFLLAGRDRSDMGEVL